VKVNNFWTGNEINYLTNNYEDLTDEEMGKALGRSIPSIRGKRHYLGLVKKTNRGQFSKLPKPPKEKLDELYLEENKTPYRISQIFHVSKQTVYRWLREYNIPIKRPYTSYTNINLSETQKAYLAGYLDGDGSITISMHKNKRNKRNLGLHYETSLISKHKWFIEELHKIIGGKIQSFIYEDSRSKKEGYKIGFCNQTSALAFLKSVTPYLILKKKQAELMIKFLENRLEARREGGNNVIISDESWEMAHEIRRLNRL